MSLSKHLRVGFRFQPTEEEIFCHFVRLKMLGKDSEVDPDIAEVDFCDFDPWELPAKSRIKSDDQIWWFFCRQKTGKRTKRATKSGYWKITGKVRKIKARDTKKCIGKKRILVFHLSSAPKRGTNWVIHEYHPLSYSPQRPYVICRLEKKTGKEDATPGCDEGESSGSSGNISDIENQAAATAISEEPGHAEVNADLLSQPPLSSGGLFNDDGILFLSDLFDYNQTINRDMEENHPEPGNSLAHQGPNVIRHFENKSGKMAGTPSCDEGEPSGAANIIRATEIPVAPTAISEEPGHAEVNADLLSQAPLSSGGLFTDDDILFLSDLFDYNQTINQDMEENHPEPGTSLAHQGPYVTSSLKNKTDGLAGIPGCGISKPSSNITFDIENQVAPPVIPAVQVSSGLLSRPLLSSDCYSTEDNSLVLSNSFNDGHNNMQVSCGADEPEESFADISDWLVDPYENYSKETANNLSDIDIQRQSLKRLDFQDGPASVDTDVEGVEGVDGRVKRSRLLAPGESLP